MKEINNLTYKLEINFVTSSGINSLISIKFNDDGLRVKSVRIGEVCIVEETIKGRILSGKLENSEGYCGYRYDYQNGENITNINPNIDINTAVSLINESKWKSSFITTELVLSSILRNDYRVVILNEGSLKIIKTVTAENEEFEHCSLQETIELLKLSGEESFVEKNKKRIYKIDDKIIEESNNLVDGDIKFKLCELSNILSLNPQNYKDLIEIKNQIQKRNTFNGDNAL